MTSPGDGTANAACGRHRFPRKKKRMVGALARAANEYLRASICDLCENHTPSEAVYTKGEKQQWQNFISDIRP